MSRGRKRIKGASTSPSPSPSPACAACKLLKKRCGPRCIFASYFPPNDVPSFQAVRKIFTTTKIIKMLQDIPESKRKDAVKSMVYEANVRVMDPVYGCTGLICVLRHQISSLEAQLASLHALLLDFLHINGTACPDSTERMQVSFGHTKFSLPPSDVDCFNTL